MEVNLQIPGIRNYNEDALLLIIPTMTYSKTVLVMVGTNIIDKALSLMTAGELAKATTTWRQGHFGAVMSGLLQLSHSSSDKSEMTKGATGSSQKSDPVEVQKFQLDVVKGPVHTTQKVIILPFGTINVWANTSVRGHLHVSTCPHRTGAWSPVASSTGIHSYLWGTTPWFLKGASLPAQFEHPCH